MFGPGSRTHRCSHRPAVGARFPAPPWEAAPAGPGGERAEKSAEEPGLAGRGLGAASPPRPGHARAAPPPPPDRDPPPDGRFPPGGRRGAPCAAPRRSRHSAGRDPPPRSAAALTGAGPAAALCPALPLPAAPPMAAPPRTGCGVRGVGEAVARYLAGGGGASRTFPPRPAVRSGGSSRRVLLCGGRGPPGPSRLRGCRPEARRPVRAPAPLRCRFSLG